MKQRSWTFRRTTLAGQLLGLQVTIILVVLVAVAALTLAQSAATFSSVEGRRVAALAEQLADNPLVRDRLPRPAPGETLAPLVQTIRTQSDVTSVTIADARGIVVSSTDPILVRTLLPLGDPGVAEGRGWSGELVVDGSRELVAQVPVLSAEPGTLGQRLGTVMIGERSPTVWQRARDGAGNLAIFLGIASLVGIAGSWLEARRIKHQTLGLEPREIAGLAEYREAMLYGIAEGVIALDPQHRITLVNAVGRTLLDLPEDSAGRSLAELGIDGRLHDVLTGSELGERDEVVVRGGRVLVMNRMDVTKDGRRLGSVTTLRDRTELARLEREMGSFRSTTEVLRAQAHEFANQLHTISGLIQIRDYDEVVRYVNALARHRESLDLTLTSRIHDTAVAALLMAKSAQAAERRVRPADRSADVATVVGNLVDNAVDAAAAAADPDRDAWVEVELRQDSTAVEIVVRDSGPGVAPELAQEVFSHGFTTKAAQGGERGIGLALTRLICKRHGGEVAVTNTPDGAMFTARLTVPERVSP
ncbi:ATP-binding protein [Actinoplanes sp. CA-252034]|uniref:sensor histidine kinase n=1 Tax=Actinoplanes sp. CA-252034 TaxID=3239906 RepID=UPI003D97354C